MADTMIYGYGLVKEYSISRGMFKRKELLRAVGGVTLQVNKGEVLGLVGESGCGKTTLARLILGMIPPTAGSVEIAGQNINKLARLERAKTIQPIFQDPYSSLNPSKTIGSILTLPLRIQRDRESHSWEKRVRQTMDLVGLAQRMYNQHPNQLSGGQRQRVAIARALITRPAVVVCDEPTSALDVSVQSQILNLLKDLREELNLTYVLISHNLAVVQHMATRVAVMYFGHIVEEEKTNILFEEPKHEYTKKLLGSILVPDPNKRIFNKKAVNFGMFAKTKG
tara:strand:- start:117 stop:959 length:843 start_codon:yes stop_codon:yes gene_type:complete